jgi:hypothetical protein
MEADINAKIEAGQEEIKARQYKVDAESNASHDQLKQDINSHIEATINSVRSDLEQTIRKRMEDVLLFDNLKTQSLQTELTVRPMRRQSKPWKTVSERNILPQRTAVN